MTEGPALPLSHTFRVRYAECDLQGIVFNPHYLAYMDIGMTELLRAALGGYSTTIERGLDMVVVETRLRFLVPAQFDDLLTLEVGVTRLGNTSISTTHRIKREDELILEGEIHHVLVDLKTRSKVTIPDWMRDGLAPWVEEPVDA